MMDTRIARWWSNDPVTQPHQSPYSMMDGNPVLLFDPMGDSSVVDKYGYMLHTDTRDLRVFMKDGDNLTPIGQLGGDINADVWFDNLLKVNAQTSQTTDPFTFKRFVQKEGRWDYKNLNPNNPNMGRDGRKEHILGVAFALKHAGSTYDTEFHIGDLTGRAEDLNNMHFGFVGKANGTGFSETFMLKTAGKIEMGKWQDEYKTERRLYPNDPSKWKRKTPQVPKKWRPGSYITKEGKNMPFKIIAPNPPYGDAPEDHMWIKNGFQYFKDHPELRPKYRTPSYGERE